jgi:hypothetical protein
VIRVCDLHYDEPTVVQVGSMPSWILECSNCKLRFMHSLIKDSGALSYFTDISKPAFPSGGSEFECPNCATKALYQRTDLLYQA